MMTARLRRCRSRITRPTRRLARLDAALELFHLGAPADDERRALVYVAWLHVEDGLVAVAGRAARLFGEEGDGVGLVEQAQPALRVLCVRRVDEDTAAQKRPVKVCHHRADEARRVARPGLARLQTAQVPDVDLGPAVAV